MPAHAIPQPGKFATGFPPLARRVALTFGAVVFGAYLGFSTVAEIDPFYRQPQYSKSYTTDGWRGADAAPPPAATSSVIDRGYGDYAFVSRIRDSYPPGAAYAPDSAISDYSPATAVPEAGASDFEGGASSSLFESGVADEVHAPAVPEPDQAPIASVNAAGCERGTCMPAATGAEAEKPDAVIVPDAGGGVR